MARVNGDMDVMKVTSAIIKNLIMADVRDKEFFEQLVLEYLLYSSKLPYDAENDDFDSYYAKAVELSHTPGKYHNMFSAIERYKQIRDSMPKDKEWFDVGLSDVNELDFEAISSSLGGKGISAPKALAEFIAMIVQALQVEKDPQSIFDPTIGVAEMTVEVGKSFPSVKDMQYVGLDIDPLALKIARTNFAANGIALEQVDLKERSAFDNQNDSKQYDVVLVNNPFSEKWSPKDHVEDKSFKSFGVVPSPMRADLAFLIEGFARLSDDGILLAVEHPATLYREGSDAEVRKRLIDLGVLEAIIKLPGHLFDTTRETSTLWVIRKNHKSRDVLFLDGTDAIEVERFARYRDGNELNVEEASYVIDILVSKETVKGKSHLATFEEIESNDFNLSIARYIDYFQDDIYRESVESIVERMKDTQTNLGQSKDALKHKLEQLSGAKVTTLLNHLK
jgi:type I restriction enzyme M protein